MRKRLLSSLQWLLLLLALGAIYQWQKRHLLDTGSEVSVTALPLLQGGTAELAEPGKPTLIYFFAPWCNICAVSMGNLDGLDHEQLNIKRVAMDYASLNDVAEFVDDNQVKGDILLGHEGLKQHFRVLGYPTYYLLDADNRIVASDMGYSSTIGLKVRQALAL